MKTTEARFKGVTPCGCTTWLYAGEFDTDKQREKTIAKALKSGLDVIPILTEEEAKQARAEWTTCEHEKTWPDAIGRAKELLAQQAANI